MLFPKHHEDADAGLCHAGGEGGSQQRYVRDGAAVLSG
jgi:hypothetical protein